MTQQHKRNWWLALVAVGAVLMAASLPTLTVYAGLPPRSTPEPQAVYPPSNSGGFIELQIKGETLSGPWTVIQWKDHLGDWHTVEGWQGKPLEDGRVLWWVQHSDLSKGPFRWMVYSRPGGQLLAQSTPFYLPHVDGEVIKIEVTLAP